MTDCISCKRDVNNDTEAASYPCPSCGKERIIRCGNCRRTAITYTCPDCEFEGP